MRCATLLLSKAFVLVVGVITAGTVWAANTGAASDAARRPSNSFNLFVAPPPVGGNVQLPGQGVGIASGKTVVIDPYKVPLIQNAGSLTPGR